MGEKSADADMIKHCKFVAILYLSFIAAVGQNNNIKVNCCF